VKEVRIDQDTGTASVIVPDYQLSLAIGKEGQNARLAARLTGWRIDIRSESQAAEEATAARAPKPAPAAKAPEAPAAPAEEQAETPAEAPEQTPEEAPAEAPEEAQDAAAGEPSPDTIEAEKREGAEA
jgi:N utilization substance protein A